MAYMFLLLRALNNRREVSTWILGLNLTPIAIESICLLRHRHLCATSETLQTNHPRDKKKCFYARLRDRIKPKWNQTNQQCRALSERDLQLIYFSAF